METGEVEAVVKLTDISPVPGMGAHVAGLSALRSRVLTIIDVAALIRMAQATPVEQAQSGDHRRISAAIATA